jgi:AraC-like DNA-binding protein
MYEEARLLDTEASAPTERVLFAQVQMYIEQRLADPTLSPDTIAAAHYLTVRSLQRLFQGHGLSVSESIRARRLSLCRRDLTDPKLARAPIRSIARRRGFSDYVTFSRGFKAVYGTTPREYRHLCTILDDDAQTVACA